MEPNNDIDDLFRDIVEPNEMNHSDKVWESLNYHLEKKANESNRAIIFRLRISVAILLLLLCSFMFYFLFNPGENNKLQTSFSENISKIKSLRSEGNHLSLIKNTESIPASRQTKQAGIQSEVSIKKVEKSTRLVNAKPLNALDLKKSAAERRQGHVNNSVSNSVTSSVLENKINEITPGQMESENLFNKDVAAPNPLDSNFISAGNLENNQVTTTNIAVPVFSKEKIDSIQKNQLKHRFSVMAYFSPDATMKYLKDNNNYDKQSEGDYNSQETQDFSYNTGILVGYDFTKHWTVKFGCVYAYLSQTIKPKTVYASAGADGLAHYQFNTTYGTSELPRDQSPSPMLGDSLNINSNSIQSLQVISIPFIAKYQITRKKFSYYTQFGLSLNFLAGEKLIVETTEKSQRIDKIEGLNEYYFGGMVGFGISYNPTKKLAILIEPTVRGAITPINNNTPITTHPISFGLALGLGWHF